MKKFAPVTTSAIRHPELVSRSQSSKDKKCFISTAFTLIELLVVIVIIGILATISVAQFNRYQERARTAKMSMRISQEKKLFMLECIGNGKDLSACPVTYVAYHMANETTSSFRYGASPTNCKVFCASKTNESINQYSRIPTREEAIWFAATTEERCTASWHYEDNSALLFTAGYPMYYNQIIGNCGPINTGDVARYVEWSADQSNETSLKADCACISYPNY